MGGVGKECGGRNGRKGGSSNGGIGVRGREGLWAIKEQDYFGRGGGKKEYVNSSLSRPLLCESIAQERTS